MTTKFRFENENVAYHAARILLLVALCGKPRDKAGIMPGVEGRTLLAKLDFFLRYPAYLDRALAIRNLSVKPNELGITFNQEAHTVESRMVRYLYGPWDHIYYLVLAYLIGKQLLTIEWRGGTEVFRITAKGYEIAGVLARDEAFADIAQRARVVYSAFNKYSGNGLKEFIYRHFPEVVKRELGATI